MTQSPTRVGFPTVMALLALMFAASELHAQDYERLLIPVFVTDVPGQYASRWQTELKIYNGGDETAYYYPRGCGPEDCSTLETWILPRTTQPVFALPLGPAGYLYLRRPESSKLHISAALVDTGRGSLNPGLAVPIVREKGLFSGTVQLVNVPGPDNARVRNLRLGLRIYVVDRVSTEFHVGVFRESSLSTTAQPLFEFQVTARCNSADPECQYAPAVAEVFGLENSVPAYAESLRFEIRASDPSAKFWAMASATNNESQVVRLIPPSTSGE